MGYLKPVVLASLFAVIFQTFYYVKELPALYYLSKLGLPAIGGLLAATLFIRDQGSRPGLSKAGWITILGACYFISAGCLSAKYFYDQPLKDTLSSQVKIFPFFVFFAAYYALSAFKTRDVSIYRGIIVGGTVLCAIYIAAAFLVDVSSFNTGESSILSNSEEKGYRIRFPAALLEIAFFCLLHTLRKRPTLVGFLLFVLLVYFLVFELKQRTELAAIAIAAVASLFGNRWRDGLFLLALAGGLVVAMVPFFSASAPEILQRYQQDSSWQARLIQMQHVESTVSNHPYTLFTGVGKLSEASDRGYKDLLGFYFTTADLGWIGVIHEYGVIGTVTLGFLIWIVFRETSRACRLQSFYSNSIANGLRSYMIMWILLSALAVKFLYLSGTFFSIYAICVYLNETVRQSVNTAEHSSVYGLREDSGIPVN